MLASGLNKAQFPRHGWLGLTLLGVFWCLYWSLPGLRTHWAFFPQWLGYCLLVDALVVARKGDSMLTRSARRYAGLFLVSIPAWWLFELFNRRTQNWFYDGRQHFSDLEYAVLASLSFSTVMPAVFGTAELVGTFRWMEKLRAGWRIPASRPVLLGMFLVGWLMLALVLLWPRYFFPFLWSSAYLILEPVNAWLGNRTLLDYLTSGDWRPVGALWLGCLICGFFWEFWNYYSYPKWIYQIPFVDVLHVFEMPILGYGGYLPFALELYAIYHLLAGSLGARESRFIQFTSADVVEHVE